MRGRLSRRESRRRRGPVIAVLAALVVALPASVQAARSWTVVADPDELVIDQSTPVRLTVTNTSSSGSGITCVEFDLPGDFDVSGAAVVSVNGSGGSLLGWNAVWLGGSTVVFKSTLGSGALEEGDQAVFRITGTATTSGPMSWRAVAFDEPGLSLLPSCGSNAYPETTLQFQVFGVPTPTPSPTPIIVLPSLPIPTLPPILATPRPTTTPVATARPTPEPTDEPRATSQPSSVSSGDPSGPTTSPLSDDGPGGPDPAGRIKIPGDRGPDEPVTGLADAAIGTLGGLPGGLLVWAYPVFIISVPGLLLLLAVAVQAAGAFAWLPVIRRRLGAFELRRAREGS